MFKCELLNTALTRTQSNTQQNSFSLLLLTVFFLNILVRLKTLKLDEK